MPVRTTPLVRPLGLITTPNQYGQYPPGAMSVAYNLTFREPGKARNLVAWRTPVVITNGATMHSVVCGAADRVFGWGMANSDGITAIIRWLNTATAVISTATLYDTLTSLTSLTSASRVSTIVMRDHLISNTLKGMLVGDYLDPQNSAQRELRWAGMCQPLIIAINTTATFYLAEGAISAQHRCAYAAIIRRKAGDYEIASVPSPSICASAPSVSDTNASLTIAFGGTTLAGNKRVGIRAGDVVELYRTHEVDNTVGTGQPGATFYLVQQYTVTSSDESDGRCTVVDKAKYATVGLDLGGMQEKELYTNPFLGGVLARAKRQPPVAACMGSFKGYAFYGNCTDRAVWAASFASGTLVMGIDFAGGNIRTNAVGRRLILGDVTSGSATVSGVSAVHMQGIVVGQRILTSPTPLFPALTSVVSVSASSFVVSNVATGTVADGIVAVDDVLELDGAAVAFASPLDLMRSATDNASQDRFYEFAFDQNIFISAGGLAGEIVGAHLGMQMRVEPARFAQGNITVRGTHGESYVPAIPALTAAVATFTPTLRKNSLRWSEFQQPESVPLPNEYDIGFGEIQQLVATRDALWIFCSDGLRRLSGDGGNWRVDDVDPTLLLSGPRAVCVLKDVIYAWTSRGLISIDPEGFVQPLSAEVISDTFPGRLWRDLPTPALFAREDTDEVFCIVDEVSGTRRCLCFNVTHRVISMLDYFSATTAAVFMRQRLVGGVPVPALLMTSQNGVAGSNTRYALWDDTLGDASLTTQGVFQPLFDDDPFVLKHWIDMAMVFGPESAGTSLTALWGGVTFLQAHTLALMSALAECRVTFGVPRAAPAVSTIVRPGFISQTTENFPLVFHGLSLRLKHLTEQASQR